MASLSLTVQKLFRRNGKAYINWSDKTQQEFSSLADVREFASISGDDAKTLARKLALSRYFQLDPTAATPGLIEGRTVTITNESNSMVSVS